jgi:hypothetical protein
MRCMLTDAPTFDSIKCSAQLEPLGPGRLGVVVTDAKDNIVPLVRTTTKFAQNQPMTDLHHRLIKNVHDVSGEAVLNWNNALLEVYNDTYRTMKFHTDQSLDLVKPSLIGLCSFYNTPEPTHKRVLRVKNKRTEKVVDIVLEHQSVVLFSTDANANHVHQIICQHSTEPLRFTDEEWLGLTFRQSGTFVFFQNNQPHIMNNNRLLTLTTPEEARSFYYYKKLENQMVDYQYPLIHYTISPADMLPISVTGLVVDNLPDSC